jgi:hypothetical protein
MIKYRFKDKRTDNIIVADEAFINSLPDSESYENLGEANPAQEITFEALQTKMLSDVVAQATAQYDEALKAYSSNERATFLSQESEARAYSLDNTASTPTIDTLATARGVDRVVLINKVLDNLTSRDVTTGQQQAAEDAIKSCTTVAELEALAISGGYFNE